MRVLKSSTGEIDHSKEEVKVAREVLEKDLSSLEKEVLVALIAKNLEKLAEVYKNTMLAINSRIITMEVKMGKLLKEDPDTNYKFNPLFSRIKNG